MRTKPILNSLFFVLAFVALSSAQATFNESTITTPIQTILTLLRACGIGITMIAITWGIISYILGKRDALGRIVSIVIAGLIMIVLGPALEYITGNAAFNI